MTSKLIAGMLATAGLCVVSSPAIADEGMWTFDNFPIAKVNAKYGTAIDQAWLDHVRGAAVRLSSGCSASVVSGAALVLTNNHCVAECAQSLSRGCTLKLGHGLRQAEPAIPGSANVRLLSGCGDEVTEHLGLHWIRCRRVFWMPLDAEIPAIMIL